MFRSSATWIRSCPNLCRFEGRGSSAETPARLGGPSDFNEAQMAEYRHLADTAVRLGYVSTLTDAEGVQGFNPLLLQRLLKRRHEVRSATDHGSVALLVGSHSRELAGLLGHLLLGGDSVEGQQSSDCSLV